MSRKGVKGCFCPQCGKKLFRRRTRRNVPTICNYCNFRIKDPYSVFTPKSKYLKEIERIKS